MRRALNRYFYGGTRHGRPRLTNGPTLIGQYPDRNDLEPLSVEIQLFDFNQLAIPRGISLIQRAEDNPGYKVVTKQSKLYLSPCRADGGRSGSFYFASSMQKSLHSIPGFRNHAFSCSRP